MIEYKGYIGVVDFDPEIDLLRNSDMNTLRREYSLKIQHRRVQASYGTGLECKDRHTRWI